MIDAWQSGRFVTYPVPGWSGLPWSSLLVPEWRKLKNKSVAEIVARQWSFAHESILYDLIDVPKSHQMMVRYEDFLKNRTHEVQRICKFVEVPSGPRMEALCSNELPLSRYTLSPRDANEWRRHEMEIDAVMPRLDAILQKLE